MVDQAEVMQGLDRLSDQLREIDQQRSSWQGQLNEQVLDMRMSTESLRRETQTLSTALRKPQVRGRWGELHLRRAVELAGLVERCDFTEQVRLDDGALRPDLVVHLAGDQQVVVDAKVPLDAYLDATGDRRRRRARADTCAALRASCAPTSTSWPRSPTGGPAETPEFVVLFVPAESFLSAAMETDPGLIEYAAKRQIVLATPTTLIALLRTVAHGWSHEALAEQAQEIHRLGRDLHSRLATLAATSTRSAAPSTPPSSHYNRAMGSLEPGSWSPRGVSAISESPTTSCRRPSVAPWSCRRTTGAAPLTGPSGRHNVARDPRRARCGRKGASPAVRSSRSGSRSR